MKDYNQYYQMVDEIENNLRLDLIGTTDEFETIDGQEPLSVYDMGILFPQRKSIAETEELNEQSDDLQLTDDDDTMHYTMTYKPSAMGISVVVPSGVSALQVKISFGKYTRKDRGEDEGYTYERLPISASVSLGVPNRVSNERSHDFILENLTIGLYCHVRNVLPDGSKLATVSMVNERVCNNRLQEQNEGAMFQCKLEILSESEFLPISRLDDNIKDPEVLTNLMLYRNVQNYAIGHGCATRVVDTKHMESDFLPSQEVVQLMPRTLDDNAFLKMANYKGNPNREAMCAEMDSFIDEYRLWADGLKLKSDVLAQYHTVAEQSLKNIGTCIERLRAGVDILRRDDVAWQCFTLMNLAMLLQRVNTKHCNEDTVYWYPFQMAYILQILPDIVDERSKYRDVVDLLWFPTGGGKTEAYLGVSAFVIFNRRIRKHPDRDTTAIIMRYTLRLLTIQQFERANALICACEYLRKEYNIGGGEISIGLWIGSSMTPNRVETAVKRLRELRENTDAKILTENPIQVTTCPWCGASLDVGCYSIQDDHMVVRCKNNDECRFHERLPIYIVDEDIYEASPTLVLSTVDKFARITWEEKARNLFGKHIPNSLPPELIVQDELHLISGALGSVTGAYETMVDYLSSSGGVHPKIVTSTATVKNAHQQVKNLYDRETLQFPPNGFDYDDSFFAVKATRDSRPVRRYLGLCETGGSMANLTIRVYSNLMFTRLLAIKKGIPESVVDQYYTIVGYFNALRDLGSSATIINDRIHGNVKNLINHKFKNLSAQYGLTVKDIPIYELSNELTSRKSSKEVKDTLENLNVPYTTGEAYSYVLSSNMLSVGIDIDRLGVMTVYNQPKTTSEYIQATSRVGRSNPGVILALYNTMRSRDKSYYENFSYYHKTYYQQVEPTSVTPFSRVCIKKAIPGVFIGMVRQSVPKFNSSCDAGKFDPDHPKVLEVKRYILERVSHIDPSAVALTEDYLDYLCEQWEYYTDSLHNLLQYIDYNAPQVSLLHSTDVENALDFPKVLNSLRNVDAECNVYLTRRFFND